MKKITTVSAVAAVALLAGCGTGGKSLMEFRGEALSREAPQESGDGAAADKPAEKSLPLVTGEVGLLDAINLSLAQNLSLREAFLKRGEARGQIVEVRAGAYPSLSVGGNFTRDLVDPGDEPNAYGATWSVNQPLWRSGVVSAGLRYAKLYAESTDESIREAVQNTIFEVSKGYLSVLLSQKMVEVYTESLGVAERMLDTAQKKRKAGTASDYEVLRAEVEVATSRAALIREQNNSNSAKIELLHLIGADQASAVALTGSLEYTAETNDVAELTRTAMLHRPDLLRAEAALRMADEQINVVKGEYGPTADAFISGKYANPNPNDPAEYEWDTDMSAGVSLSWKLFDGYARKGRMMQAKAKRRQAEAALVNAEEQARVEIIKAVQELQLADELYNSQAKNIDLSKEALRMLEGGFKVGKNTQIEVLDARSALTKAKGDYYNAIYSQTISRLAIRKAAGTLGIDATRKALPGLQLESAPL